MKGKVLVALLCGALIGAAPVYASENQTDGTWSEDLCVSGYVGSAIFLHCSANRPTGGCISVPEDQMITILKNIQPDCQIIIDSASGLKNY